MFVIQAEAYLTGEPCGGSLYEQAPSLTPSLSE